MTRLAIIIFLNDHFPLYSIQQTNQDKKMKNLMIILLMATSFNSAHAIWAGPIGDMDCFGKNAPKFFKKITSKKICGVIRTNGFAKGAFIEADEGDIVRITGLRPKVHYADGCAYGKVKTKNYRRTIHVSRYEF